MGSSGKNPGTGTQGWSYNYARSAAPAINLRQAPQKGGGTAPSRSYNTTDSVTAAQKQGMKDAFAALAAFGYGGPVLAAGSVAASNYRNSEKEKTAAAKSLGISKNDYNLATKHGFGRSQIKSVLGDDEDTLGDFGSTLEQDDGWT